METPKVSKTLNLPKAAPAKQEELQKSLQKAKAYHPLRLPHFYLTSGAKVVPEVKDGLYHPKSQAEEEQLAYYASKGLVKGV